jgi:serine/threonine protein kinase
MSDNDQPDRQDPPPADETLPHWKPPASATRPGLSGTREGARGNVSGYERTMAADSALQAPGPLQVGDIIGERYLIAQLISSGGFGAVYRATDRQIRNHQVALKLLHQPAADEQARAAALHELALIASVSHPSVVQFKDYGWHEGRLWFAMPWYRGETLDKRYASSDGLAPIGRAEARPIFAQVAQGLAAMHEVGIHHHDIKPENIFLANIAGLEAGLPVLLDLGIAAERGEGPKGLTVEYASPETAAAVLGNRDKPIGAAADVFSLALVLRNLLEPDTALPMQGTLMPFLHKRATELVPPLRKRELRYLQPAFARWLSLDPLERPSAAGFAAELALLTQPEERREARVRLLRRIVPIVLAAGVVVALLLVQVRKQKTELNVERARLSQQSRENDELRKRSTEQLQQLEAESQRVGSQDQGLARATANAHQFKLLFERADARADSLNKKLHKISDERDALNVERDALTRERDALVSTNNGLTHERDQLLMTRDGLTRERDALSRARDALEQDRNTMLAQRNDALHERDRLEGQLPQLQKQLETTAAERDRLKSDVSDLQRQLADLQSERDHLAAAQKALEAQQQAQKPQASP